MNKILISFLLFGFVQTSFAQVHIKDSTEAYNYWAKRGIIEVVYAYMNDYVDAVGEDVSNEEKLGVEKYYNEFIVYIKEGKDLPKFDSVAELLKSNSWSNANSKLFNPLLNSYNRKLKLNDEFFDCTKPGSNDKVTLIPGKDNKEVAWKSTIKDVLVNYENSLASINEKNTNKVHVDSHTSIKNEPKEYKESIQSNRKVSKKFHLSSTLTFLSIFLLGLITGGCVVFIISKVNIFSILGMEKNRYLEKYSFEDKRFIFKYIGLVFVLKKQKDSYKKEFDSKGQNSEVEISELQNRINQLKKENQNLIDENIQLGKSVDEIKTNHFVSNDNADPVPHTNEPETKSTPLLKKYFSMPESNGSFRVIDGEVSNDGRKYFKIEYEESTNKGEIFYLSGERDNRAINQMEDFLKPVCDIENISNSSTATKVELINSGKVVLLDDSWHIDQEHKIKIKLY